MNIVIINHHTNIGKYGSNSRHFKICNELSKQGHNMLLIGSSYNHRKGKYIHEDKIRYDKVNDNFTFVSLKSSPKYNNNILRFINYFDFTLKSLFVDLKFIPDIVVGSSVHPFTWISAYKIAKKNNAEFHIEIRDIWPLSLYEEVPKVLRKPIFTGSKLYEKFFYRKAKSIVVTAPLAFRYLHEEFGISSTKVNYVPHGIDINKFDQLLEINEKINLVPSKLNITYTGALSASEGLENFILLAEEFSDNKKVHFNIVGGGNQRDYLKSLVQKKNLKNITFFEHVNSYFIPQILMDSDILWCGLKNRKAFKYSISKNKFYEYLASSKPIIFHSDVKSSALEEANVAYIVGLDRLPVKELNYLINNPMERSRMGGKGREFVENHYDISTISKKFIKLFAN